MRVISLILLVVFLVGCKNVSSTAQSTGTVTAPLPEALRLFRDVCLNTAPSFKKARAVAEKQGITNFQDTGWKAMALTEDKRLSIQIYKNIECAVTTPSSLDERTSHAFMQTLNDYLGYKVLPQHPMIIELEDDIFRVFHDRSGGEAFVIVILR